MSAMASSLKEYDSVVAMVVTKRDGRTEEVQFDKITTRIKKLCYGLDATYIQPQRITQKVIEGLFPGVTTSELDELSAQTGETP